MKKIQKSIAIICITLFVVSCEKEITKNSIGVNKPNSERINPEQLETEMNAFITTSMESPLQFSTYEAEDALLMIEAGLNYHTATPNNNYDDVYLDSTSFTLTCYYNSDEAIYYTQGDYISSIWPEVLEIVIAAKERSPFAANEFAFNIVVDIEFLNLEDLQSPPENGNQINVEIVLKTLVANGPDPNGPYFPWPCEYDNNDHWNGYYQIVSPGGCGSNTSTTSTCFKEMYKKLSPHCNGFCDGGYYTNITGSFQNLTNYPGNPWQCTPYNTYLHKAPYLTGQVCFSPSDMDCFTNGARSAAAHYAPIDPLTGNPYCTLGYQFFEYIGLCSGCDQFHYPIFTYGIARTFN